MAPAKKAPRKMEYAGFWQRFAAIFIDQILLSALFVPIFLILTFSGAFIGTITWAIIFAVFTVWYEVYFIGKYGATYGKKWIEIRVVDADGKVIGYKGAFVRWLGRIIVHLTIGIGYLIIPFTQNKQGLHDMIAKTYVIKAKTEF